MYIFNLVAKYKKTTKSFSKIVIAIFKAEIHWQDYVCKSDLPNPYLELAYIFSRKFIGPYIKYNDKKQQQSVEPTNVVM